MEKEIDYNGMTTVPSDYACGDGDLSLLVNMLPEDGGIKPIQPPTTIMQLEDNQDCLYLHKNTGYTHYIIHNTDTNYLYWTSDGETFTPLGGLDDITLYQVTSVGNTLVVLTDDGIYYWLWKGETDGYLELGNNIPELPISFGLQGEMIRGDEFRITWSEDMSWDTAYTEFPDDIASEITSQVLAKVNKFIAEKSTNDGKFIYPFLVRYAYRMYDGSLIRQSPPVLMVCSSDLAPQVTGKKSLYGLKYSDCRIYAMIHQLDYQVMDDDAYKALQNWSDIIKSVDVFISAPIYTYDQSGECTRFAIVDESDSYCICLHTNQAVSTDTYPLRYQVHVFHDLMAKTFDPDNLTYDDYRLMLPQRSAEDVCADIRDCQAFYFLKSYKIDELSTNKRQIISVSKEYLQSLVNREVMTDDYDSHDTLIPSYSFGYNSRINVANIKKRLYQGASAYQLFPYTNGDVRINIDNPLQYDGTLEHWVYFFIRQDGKEIVVKGDSGHLAVTAEFVFLYYPNVNCYKAIIAVQTDDGIVCCEFDMEQHDFLNGAFYFSGWDASGRLTTVPTVSTLDERTIEINNKIYTSEVNNPFYFPLSGINTVGTGNIIGICSAVKALSQGQFGEFPLYAFTTEGVWALELSDTGTYKARQPITRDVCINADSLTQIDTAVLFATDRGIMLIQGSETVCISDVLNGKNILPLTALPNIDDFAAEEGFDHAEDITPIDFMDFVRTCRMMYDYEHQRIVVYSPGTHYAYVWSLKSKQWGMMESEIKNNVNSYPDAVAVLSTGAIVNYSDDDPDADYKGLLVTRPLKLDGSDLLKTVDTIAQRGYFRNGHIKSMLWASRDLYNWFVVWTSTDHWLRGFAGTPYKYFRIGLMCELADDENLAGCTVSHTPRHTNRLR